MEALVVQYLISSPNHNCVFDFWHYLQLFSILFHHQTTTPTLPFASRSGCLVSYFITKPQLPPRQRASRRVVQYLISSPNHNRSNAKLGCHVVVQYLISSPNHNLTLSVSMSASVVQYLISSPNHNPGVHIYAIIELFSILFHHQTTTSVVTLQTPSELFSILFHHQTTTLPLPCAQVLVLFSILFHHQTTTVLLLLLNLIALFSILFHHQTTTQNKQPQSRRGCLVSYFITKPQRYQAALARLDVVQYLISSPNHNFSFLRAAMSFVVQYLISSPNHNSLLKKKTSIIVVQYLISSPNHNYGAGIRLLGALFSILFHHQTTT